MNLQAVRRFAGCTTLAIATLGAQESATNPAVVFANLGGSNEIRFAMPSAEIKVGAKLWLHVGLGERRRVQLARIIEDPHPCAPHPRGLGVIEDAGIESLLGRKRVFLVSWTGSPQSPLEGRIRGESGPILPRHVKAESERALKKHLLASIAGEARSKDPVAERFNYFPLREIDTRIIEEGPEFLTRRLAAEHWELGNNWELFRIDAEWSYEENIVALIGIDISVSPDGVVASTPRSNQTHWPRMWEWSGKSLSLDRLRPHTNVFDFDGDGRPEVAEFTSGYDGTTWTLRRFTDGRLGETILRFSQGC